MADKREKPVEDEIKIPVFSVLKKGSIIKAIVLNIPPPESDSSPESGESDPVLIGRHPDCHIVLDHPSISRIHLDIRAKPISQKLTVTDRSSVHGTWVSGIKIQPLVPVDLVEGDTLKLGASTRMYRLRWVPLSRAFDVESALDPVLEEKEETHQDEISWSSMPNSSEVWGAQIPSAPPLLEPFNPPCSEVAKDFFEIKESSEDENLRLLNSEKKVMSSSLLSRRNKSVGFLQVPAGKSRERTGGASFDPDYEVKTPKENNPEGEEVEGKERFDSAKENFTPNISAVPKEAEEVFHSDKENWTPEVPRDLKSSALVLGKLVKNGRDEEKTIATDEENLIPEISFSMKLLEEGMELQKLFLDGIMSSSSRECTPLWKSGLPVSDNWMKGEDDTSLSSMEDVTPDISIFFNKESWIPEICRDLNFDEIVSDSLAENSREEEGVAIIDKKNLTPEIPSSMQSVKSSSNEIKTFALPEDMFYSERENWAPEISDSLQSELSTSKNCENNINKEDSSILTERIIVAKLSSDQEVHMELQDSSLDVITASNVEEEMYHLDAENCIIEVPVNLKLKKPISIGREEAAFASDNENSGRISEKALVGLTRSQSDAIATTNSEESRTADNLSSSLILKKHDFKNQMRNGREDRFPSDKENLTPDVSGVPRSNKPFSETQARIEREITRKRVERVPFQPLLDNNSMIYTPTTFEKEGDSNSINFNLIYRNPVEHQPFHKAGGGKKNWNIVVDTNCFLHAESRRALELLEGLRGTHLIIPIMVVRELDYLKRQESWFRNTTRKASSALRWIEECMVKSSWWIHVQSSVETSSAMLSTPPASPRSLMEIVTPTAEDHILDTALLFKRIKADGQLILLSSSVTLKIKAMAEGLPCEEPNEFRESLVNPYSRRFLWVGSSPRGSTWTCTDEMGLNGRKAAKVDQVAKGLKIILPRE